MVMKFNFQISRKNHLNDTYLLALNFEIISLNFDKFEYENNEE